MTTEATPHTATGNPPGDEDLISAYEASALLGINRATVLSRVVSGKLVGKEIAGRILVTRASVMALKAELDAEEKEHAKKGGRRKKAASRGQ